MYIYTVNRPKYLKALIEKNGNGLIKVITGLRRVGKSYLLFELFRHHLLESGVSPDHIIAVALDDDLNLKLRNPLELGKYIREKIHESHSQYYVFLDEIQKVEPVRNPYLPDSKEKVTFIDVLLGIQKIKNVDVYVTGSNSKMLSSEVLTEFRGRGDEIHVRPLSYSEFCDVYEDKRNAWRDYITYGGMPYVLSLQGHDAKSQYLKHLVEHTYISDVLDRNRIRAEKSVLDDLLNTVSSSVGSLTNPNKIANTFASERKLQINSTTIDSYIGHFVDAFLLETAKRYDVKGRKYIGSLYKYYFADVGLRNARLNFRQNEESHIMENVIFNELLYRGFDVDIGVVNHMRKIDGKLVRCTYEVDFVANKGGNRFYIQSALNVASEEKRIQETNSLNSIKESFKKIVIVKDNIVPWHDEKGILYMGVEEFLLNEHSLEM